MGLSARPRLDYQTARQLHIAAFWRVCEIMPSQAQAKDAVEVPVSSVSGRSVWTSYQPLDTSRRARCGRDRVIESLSAQGVASRDEVASMPLQLLVRVR